MRLSISWSFKFGKGPPVVVVLPLQMAKYYRAVDVDDALGQRPWAFQRFKTSSHTSRRETRLRTKARHTVRLYGAVLSGSGWILVWVCNTEISNAISSLWWLEKRNQKFCLHLSIQWRDRGSISAHLYIVCDSSGDVDVESHRGRPFMML